MVNYKRKRDLQVCRISFFLKTFISEDLQKSKKVEKFKIKWKSYSKGNLNLIFIDRWAMLPKKKKNSFFIKFKNSYKKI